MSLSYDQSPDDEQLQALGEILGEAFAFDPAQAGKWFEATGLDNLRTLRDGQRVVGGLILIPMGQYFGGRSVPMVGVAGVGVAPDQRRRGRATAMIQQMLRELSDRGVALSALYGSNQPLYRGQGYEQAGSRFIGRIAPSAIVANERELIVQPATEAQQPRVASLYRQYAATRPGHLDRGAYIWPRLKGERFGVAAHGLLFENAGGQLEGYLYYRPKRVPGDDHDHDLEITDVVATTPRAWRRIWTSISDLTTVVRQVIVYTAPTDPLYFVQPHPRLQLTLHENWMLRIIDVQRALTERGYPRGLHARIVLEVEDPLLAANARRFVLEVEDGQAMVRDARGQKPAVRLHVRALAAIYSGFATPETMAACDLLEGDPRACQQLRAVFAGPAPWMREMF